MDGPLSSRQAIMILVALTFPMTLIYIPPQTIAVARQDAWLAYLLSAALGVGLFLAMALVSRRFPEQDLMTALVGRFPWLGRFLLMLLMLVMLTIVMRDLRGFVDFTDIILLPATPLPVLTLLTAGCAIAAARLGLTVLGRATEYFLPQLVIVAALLPALLANQLQFRFLRPVLGNGLGPVLEASWLTLPAFLEVVLLPLLLQGRWVKVKDGLYGVLISVLSLQMVMIITILTIGPTLGSRLIFAPYEMIRQIRLTDFLDRLDLALVAIWMPAALMKVCIILYFLVKALQALVPVLSPRELAGPVGILLAALPLWFYASALEVLAFNRFWPALSVPLVVVIVLFLLAFLRPKRVRVHLPTALSKE